MTGVMADSRDTGFTLDPKYDAAGLITAVVTDRASGAVLMVAHMNAEALRATLDSGEAHEVAHALTYDLVKKAYHL